MSACALSSGKSGPGYGRAGTRAPIVTELGLSASSWGPVRSGKSRRKWTDAKWRCSGRLWEEKSRPSARPVFVRLGGFSETSNRSIPQKVGAMMQGFKEAFVDPMRVTLHVDLVNTTLADFAEHYAGDVFSNQEELLGARNVAPIRITGGETGADVWEISDDDGHIRINPWPRGTTGISYTMHNDRIPGQGVAFELSATRYRIDRLKLILRERDGEAYAVRLRQWLLLRWGGGGVIEQPKEEAPTKRNPAPPAVYMETDIQTTLVDYLITRLGWTQKRAVERVRVDAKTYRRHKRKDKILSEQDFLTRTGVTLATAANQVDRGDW